MRYLMILVVLFAGTIVQVNAQVFFKAEHIGTSSFRDKNNQKVGGEGSAMVIRGGAKIPLSMKMNENNRPTAWAIGLGGGYTKLKNENLQSYFSLEEILNAQISLIHLRPLNKKWSMLFSLGAGIYTDRGNFSNVSLKNVMGQGGAIAIRHLRPNLDIGGGIALNNSFGYPMIFPSLYFNWTTGKRYNVNISIMDALNISAGMKMNDYFKLKMVIEMGGMGALSEKDGEDMIFTHQYIIGGLQPEITLGKSFSIPITIGVSGYREGIYKKRELKYIFNSDRKDDEINPHFSPAPYVSIGIKYGF